MKIENNAARPSSGGRTEDVKLAIKVFLRTRDWSTKDVAPGYSNEYSANEVTWIVVREDEDTFLCLLLAPTASTTGPFTRQAELYLNEMSRLKKKGPSHFQIANSWFFYLLLMDNHTWEPLFHLRMPNYLLTYLSLGNFLLKARKNFGVNHADVVYERGSHLSLFPTSRWDRKKSQS